MARIADIKWNDTGNGPGVNVSVFVQGCSFACSGCFNQSTWDFNGGTPATSETIQQIIDGISKFSITRNLSILGGEPLHPSNRTFVANLLQQVRTVYPTIQIWMWTGYEKQELIEELYKDTCIKQILQQIDAIVIGRFRVEQKDLRLRYMGSTNQQLLYKKDLQQLL